MMRLRQISAASLQFGFFVMPYASHSAYVAIKNEYSLPSEPLKLGLPFASSCNAPSR